MVKFVPHSTEEQAADALQNELRRYVAEGPGYHGDGRPATAPLVLMLAGGRTPISVYHQIAAEPPARVHPSLYLMLSDERYVPADDAQSNYKQIAPLARGLGLPEERFVHVDTAIDFDGSVRAFEGGIESLAQKTALFSLAILGIGADGHTASLFSVGMVPAALPNKITPGSGGVAPATAHLAVDGGEQGGVRRVSAGPALLASFQRLIFFATGSGKRDVLYELSRRPDEFPAGRVMMQHPNAEIWTDQAPKFQ